MKKDINLDLQNELIKNHDELMAFRQASYQDISNDLGPMSKEEYDYYENLESK